MRVTSGKYRGRAILAPRGYRTRPVLSRVRQAIFNTLGDAVEGAHVLDLFAGTGGFVIEALSRGAASAVAVDVEGAAVRSIRANLERCAVEEPVEVLRDDALRAIERLAARGARFGLIVVAPPYFQGLQARALEVIDRTGLLAPGGILFLQRQAREHVAVPGLRRLVLEKTRTYGNTAVDYYVEAAEARQDPASRDSGP